MPSEAYARLDLVVQRKESANQAVEDLKAYDGGSVSRRIRFTVYVAALLGPKPAMERLHDLDSRIAARTLVAPPAYGEARRILGALYEGPTADNPWGIEKAIARLPETDKNTLRKGLGWFGRLALEPGAKYTAEALARVGNPRPPSPGFLSWYSAAWFLLFHGGLVVLIIVLPVMLYLQAFSSGLRLPIPWHPVLAEAAALLGLVEVSVPIRMYPVGEAAYLATFDSLKLLAAGIAMCWPLCRGIRFRDLLAASGWTRGSGIAKEIGIGLLVLPLLAVTVWGLAAILPAEARHSDDIGAMLSSGDPVVLLLTAIAGVVVAPLVEEFCYRGLLYRHLREVMRHRSPATGIGVGIAVSGILFAAMHPGGPSTFAHHLLFAAFTALLFEWRGSLLASIALHASWNLWAFAGSFIHGA